MRRLASTLLLLAAVAATVVLTAAKEKEDVLKTYEIELDSGFGLVEGGDLKIGGVKAGETTKFRLTEREPYRVIVTGEVTEPGFDSLRRDGRCDVRQQSLIGEYFIDCELGTRDSPELPDGGRVPASRTSSTIPPDLINTVMRRPYRERFRLIISELGAGLAGRPEELNEVIRRAHPALRETTETLAILRRQNKTIRDFIQDADTVSRRVEPVREQVAQWAEESAEFSGIQAGRTEELGHYWNRLPTFLRELKPTVQELRRTAEAQIPTLRKLGGAAPELEAFLRGVQPFARASRESIDDLGGAAAAGRAAIRESRQEVRELRRLARFAPALGKPLRQFLQTIDDRKRSTENDPLARETAPPAPDKTAYNDRQGFTGMEAFFNYVYYQTLAINPFDAFSHVLRIVPFTGPPCSNYVAKPTQDQIDECKSWLGPYQAGVTAPDPTDDGTAAAEARQRREGVPRAERERHRQAGEPEAPPTPGKPDPSKPQIVLPPVVQDLFDRLRRPELPRLPDVPLDRRDRAVPEGLLEYLLG